MNDAIRWLLDLDTLDFGQRGVAFDFERSMPAWMWVNIAVVAAAIAWLSYRRLAGSRPMRYALAGVRASLLLGLAAMVAGPRLVERTETIERDWVLVLVDRSASLTMADGPVTGRGTRQTRDEQLREAVRASWPMWQELSRGRTVVWLGFDGGAYDLATRRTGEGADAPIESVDLAEATGRRTSLGGALSQALQRAAARPLSAIVVLSDGRSMDEPSRAALRQLQAERAPVHTVALGSDTPVGDLAILRVDGPDVAFVNDAAPISVELVRAGAETAERVSVRLVDKATGETLAEREVEVGGEPTTIGLTHRPEDPGERTWVVEATPDGPDLVEGNNTAEWGVRLVDRPMRVLYIDGYPRWEQRYVRNLLIREKSIVCATLILATDRRYLQEGDIELDSLPDSPETWAEWDAVILGDVDPGVFTSTQLEQLREHVATRGAGLIWTAGPGSTPNRWFETALADLLPMTQGGGPVEAIGEDVVAAPTPLSERLGVLRMGETPDDPWPTDLTDPTAGWSVLRWAQRIDDSALKPAAEAIAMARSADGKGQWPLVLSMRFGAGRVLYVGTDETWRWRYGRGEALQERFWVQMIRFLGRESLARAGRSATITVSPRQSVIEQPVRVAVELLDQALIDSGLAYVTVRAERRPEPGDEAAPVGVELTLRPEGSTGALGQARVFSTTWLPTEPGVWTVEATDSALAGLDLEAEAVIALPNDELRRPETDHAALARLSEETGGRVLAPEALSRLPEDLPNRQVRILRERAETLWDTPAALIAVISLLLVEWVGRKVIRLI